MESGIGEQRNRYRKIPISVQLLLGPQVHDPPPVLDNGPDLGKSVVVSGGMVFDYRHAGFWGARAGLGESQGREDGGQHQGQDQRATAMSGETLGQAGFQSYGAYSQHQAVF
jgi:hypothetical protein